MMSTSHFPPEPLGSFTFWDYPLQYCKSINTIRSEALNLRPAATFDKTNDWFNIESLEGSIVKQH